MIFGLVAALGWGLADYGGAVAGRRIGSLWTVLIAQTFTALAMTAVVLVAGTPLDPVSTAVPLLLLNGAFGATAYLTHYRALQLGPVAVVSPVGATYALVGSILAIVVLGERPGPVALAGGLVTVLGVMLTSTDVPKLRAGTHGVPPGLPWAIVSAVCFGAGGFTLAQLSRDLGWEVGLWGSRLVQLTAFLVVGAIGHRELSRRRAHGVGAWSALATGAADLLGVLAFAIGVHKGFVTIVLVASAVFPLIAVGLSIAFLDERPVFNQYVGVALTIAGLIGLGLG